MRLSALSLGFIVAFTFGANAQMQLSPNSQNQPTSSLNEAQKRRLLLPFVRATTDCIANYSRQRSDLADLYLKGQFRSVISDAISVCSDQLQTLRVQHDQIYGFGTGSGFVAGPYANDLERAVLSRVKPELERQTALAEKRRADERARAEAVEAEKATRSSVLKSTQKLLLESVYECTRTQLVRLIGSNERAEIITEAAMTLCAKEVRAAIDAVNNTIQFETPSYRPTFEGDETARSAIRKNVQATAVILRAEKNSGVASSQPSDSARNTSEDNQMKTCLNTANTVYSKTIADKANLIQSMVELCRPEIESKARATFLATPSMQLQEARSQTLKQAAEFSESIIGVKH